MSLRDYLVAAGIILGVPLLWFILIAGLMGWIGAGTAISIVVVISFIVYIVLRRKNS